MATRWRYVLVATLGLVAGLELVASFLDSAVGTLRGYVLVTYGPDAQTILDVPAGSPAAAAGLRPGDRIDLDALYPTRTTNYDPIVSFHRMPGQTMILPFIRGQRRMIATLPLAPSQNPTNPFNAIAILCDLLLIGVGAWMVLARPSLMTWAFYAFLASTGLAANLSVAFSALGYWPVFIANVVVQCTASMFVFILVFAARVPNDRVTGWRYWLQLSALPAYVIALFLSLYSAVAWSLFGVPARYAILPVSLGNSINYMFLALVAFAFALAYSSTRGPDRVRMGWVLTGGLLYVVTSLIDNLAFIPFSGYGNWLRSGLFLVATAGTVMIAYGVATSRIVDAAFFVSRTLVVGALAAAIVVTFAVVDWLLTKRLEASRFGAVAEVGLAIALGFWLNGLHHRVDRIVDRVFFRKRYEAEQRLARAAHAVVHAPSIKVIREFLVDEPHAAFNLASAALFEQQYPETTWKRTKAIGWDARNLDELDEGNVLALHVQAEQMPLRTSEIRWQGEALPHGRARPVLAVPVIARRRVLAIALYGEHTNGADLDADEIRAIENLTNAAGAAYDHVEAEELRTRLAEAIRELEAIRTKVLTIGPETN